ncbi:hypothetical protein [Arthrobacter sp. STN4]|uniref:hypothetical protein n=1 Tax=Arthrobacter sp. STN4 TaxID=2923276 RepID=UPI002119FBC8|nr:hypothetical protein [Arthrobacter sp. STN4]MCQ9163390.1 hypothetical protein [Arthrobacter sp. STN4]
MAKDHEARLTAPLTAAQRDEPARLPTLLARGSGLDTEAHRDSAARRRRPGGPPVARKQRAEGVTKANSQV